jgi:hypothetical protein
MQIEIIQNIPQKKYSDLVYQQTISKETEKEKSIKLKKQRIQFILKNIFNKININNKKIFFEKWRKLFEVLNVEKKFKENVLIKDYQNTDFSIDEGTKISKNKDETIHYNKDEYDINDEKKAKKDEVNDKRMEIQKEVHDESIKIQEEKQQNITQKQNDKTEDINLSNSKTTKSKKDIKDKDITSKKETQIKEYMKEPNITKENIKIKDSNNLQNVNKDFEKIQNKIEYLKEDEKNSEEIEEIEYEETKTVTRIIRIEREKIKNEKAKELTQNDENKEIKKTNKNLLEILDYILNKKNKKKLIEGLKWISRIKTLKILTRNIPIYFEDYNLAHYFSLWRENTAFDTMNKTKKIQNFFKKYLKIKKKNTRNNLNDLLKNILQKKNKK